MKAGWTIELTFSVPGAATRWAKRWWDNKEQVTPIARVIIDRPDGRGTKSLRSE